MQHISATAASVALKLQDQRQSERTPVETRSMSRVNECDVCADSGWVHVQRDGASGVQRCECKRQRAVAEKLRMIPERFRNCSFENYKPEDERQAEALVSLQSNPGSSFYLHGGYRRGKTHLAVAQYRVLVQAGQSCVFQSITELIHELRRAEMDDSYFSLTLERVRHADDFHLFLDDIDKFKGTEFKSETLFDLFDTLYRRKLSLTITSNWDLRTLVENEKLDSAVVRRIDDICTALPV